MIVIKINLGEYSLYKRFIRSVLKVENHKPVLDEWKNILIHFSDSTFCTVVGVLAAVLRIVSSILAQNKYFDAYR